MRKWHSNSDEVLAKIEHLENEVGPQKEAKPPEERLSDTPLLKNDSEKPDESKVCVCVCVCVCVNNIYII